MSKLDDFILVVNNYLKSKESTFNIELVGDNRFYYERKYAELLEKYYIPKALGECHEFQPVKGHPNSIKICSVTSSARLCFLYLYDEEVSFEIALKNPIYGDKFPAQLDAKKQNIYFECKCQEVINGERESLKKSYKELLEKEFNVSNITINQYEDTLSFNLTDMGANYNEDYDKTHFNVKQLFTHLLAISKTDLSEPVTLKYVIFKPSDELLRPYPKLLKVYEELREEIKEIINSRSIKYFLEKYKGKILLDLDPETVFVEIENVKTINGVLR